MNPFTVTLPTYQCHKRVQALKIKAVVPNPRGYEMNFEDERFCPIEVSKMWLGTEGDYVVWYEDGYMGWIPAAMFEAGYTLVDDMPRGLLHLVGEYTEDDLVKFKAYWQTLVRDSKGDADGQAAREVAK